MKQKKSLEIKALIACGGTGGHLFPGIAIAQGFLDANPKNRILFVGSGRPLEKSVLSDAGFKLKTIEIGGLKGMGIKGQARTFLKLPGAIFASIRLIKKFSPDLVIGMGAYTSGPVALAAKLLNKRVILCEQNIIPGITNRLLSRFADRIYVSFDKTRIKAPSGQVIHTGNPVRKIILKASEKGNTKPDTINSDKPFTILITGGSQGAHSINIAVIDALEQIKLKQGKNLFFIHQTGVHDEKLVKEAYKIANIEADVRPFFRDMTDAYDKSDLIICRAGATTVAEVSLLGKGLIFIPYPYAADNHQELNAKSLVDAGAAKMILDKDLDGRNLARIIEDFRNNPDALLKMALKSKSFARPDAADRIIADCYNLILQDRKG